MRRFFSKLTYKAGILILALAIVIVGSSFVEKQFNVSPQLSRLAGDVAGAIFVSGKFLTPTITNAQITSPYQQVDGTVYMTGNVGIGTGSPGSKLTVTGGDGAIRGSYGRMLQSRDEWLRLNDDDQGQDYHTNGVFVDGPGQGIQGGLVVGGTSIPNAGSITATGTITAAIFAGNLTGTAATANTLRGVGSSGPHGAGYYHIGTWGGGYTSQGSILVNGAKYAETAGAAYPYRVGGVVMNMNWSGQGGQPPWLWGGSDGTNMYVYNPSNFSVNYANSAGSINASGVSAGYFPKGTSYFASSGSKGVYGYANATLQLRESDYTTGLNTSDPPRLAFHWGGVVASQIVIESDGTISIVNNPGNGYEKFKAYSVSQTSSKTAKEDFQEVNKQEILNKINALPITNWRYKSTTDNERHYGPVAEDVKPLFKLGGDPKSVNTAEYGAISLIGIQALTEKLDTQQKEIDYLKQEIEKLKAK